MAVTNSRSISAARLDSAALACWSAASCTASASRRCACHACRFRLRLRSSMRGPVDHTRQCRGTTQQGGCMQDGGQLTGRGWVDEAIRRVEADANRSADTHLHVFPLPPEWGIDLYLKDESVHPTGSLKHRLARSLFLFGLVNGDIDE